jgi:TonB family protein
MHTHAYPVPPGHDAQPHDPSLVHLPVPGKPDYSRAQALAVPLVSAASDEPPRFALAPARLIGKGSTVGPASDAALGPSRAGEEETLAERSVTVPARLLLKKLPTYPAQARLAELEADVPIEIVVDQRGVVVDARGTAHIGYGLDEAAEQSVRTYRFLPASKDGRPVRVRMHWTVEFRLK